MKVGIYVRVSTTQQIDRDSLKNQEERLRQYCKAQSYSLVKLYREEGVSAKDTKRPRLEELIRDIEAKKLNAVLVTKLDRITRSLKDLINLMEFFQKHDVKLISLTQNIDTSGSMGRLILNMLGSVAQAEREMTAERVAEDMHHRALSGKWNGGVVPFGYVTRGKLIRELTEQGMNDAEALKEAQKTTPEKGKLYCVEADAKQVQRIYDLYLEVRSLRRVTHELNKKGIKTPDKTTWAASSIRRILTNPTYVGKMWYGKRKTDVTTGKLKHVNPQLWKIVKGHQEPIVSQEIFEKVQKLLQQRYMKPSKAKQIHILGGLLRCGLCQGGMFGYSFSKKSGKTYKYYRCQNSIQKGHAVCKGMVVPAELIETAVIDILLSLSKNEKFLHDKELLIASLKKEHAKVSRPDLDAEKKALVQEERNLEEKRELLLEKLESRIIDDATFVERFDRIKQRLGLIRDRMAELASQGEEINVQEIVLQASYEELCNLPKIWPYLTLEEKQEKLRSIVNQIIVNLDKKAMKMDVKMQLFIDNTSPRKPRGPKSCHFVVIPGNRDALDAQQNNYPEPFYTLDFSLNLIELDPSYPKEPRTIGERIRKARMDRGMMIKDLAILLHVTEDTVINWELQGMQPQRKVMGRVKEFLAEPSQNNHN